ncbi:MAG: dihydrolipoyl dehydrogenase [Alphaproteobacteria bacterium]
MSNKNYDVIVIGGGPGGYVAAIRASQLGMKAAVIEREHLGGICLNWGCIPTKALLRSAEVGHLINNAAAYGFSVNEVSFDISKIVKRSRDVAKKLSAGVGFLLKKHKVSVIEGEGKISGRGKVSVGSDIIEAKHIIIATGARARTLPGLEPDGNLIWTYREAMVPSELPKSMVVMGSGAIGIEFASFYNDLGVDVTVVELQERILPVEDEEISAAARKSFEKQGIKILTSSKIRDARKGKKQISVVIETDDKTSEITVDRLVSAVGIVGNTETIGLENTKVEVDRGHIKTDAMMRTGEPGVYAIGDVCGPPWLAHKASHEGILCVEHIAGQPDLHPLDAQAIPGCTYARPQIASVGLTEAAARETGRAVKVGKFPFQGNGKAIALGESEGLVKTIFDANTGELLGAHMIGAEVTELIQGFGIAKSLETTEAELMNTVFPHPTLSEMMHESVLDAYDQAIHI